MWTWDFLSYCFVVINSWQLECSIKVTLPTSENSYGSKCCHRRIRLSPRTLFVSELCSWLWWHMNHYDVFWILIQFFIDGTSLSAGIGWTNVNSQATQKKPWIEKTLTFSRGGRQAEQRNNPQVCCQWFSTEVFGAFYNMEKQGIWREL